MNRKEYMEQLSKALEGIDAATAAEIMEDYEAHFERAKEAGRSEEEVIGELGSIEEFVQELGQFVQKEEKTVMEQSTAEQAAPAQEQNVAENTQTADEAAEEKAAENTADGNTQNEYHREYRWGQNRENGAQEDREQSQKDAEQTEWRDNGGNVHWKVKYNSKDAEERYKKKAEEYKKMAEEITGKTVRVVSDVMGQLSVQFDKAFSKFSTWANSYEKSGEDEADYQSRQENAKVHYESDTTAEQTANTSADTREPIEGYRYNGMDMSEQENYMADCNGVLSEKEGIYNISVDARSAEVSIYPSEDDLFHYAYQNNGNAGSKLVYRLDQRRTSDTLFLNVAKNERVQRKNHFSILGGVFDDTSDLQLELKVPEWVNSISCIGKSGDISAENIKVRVLQLKSTSGDIDLCGVQSAHCSAESSSGDVEVEKSSFEQLLAATKSGDSTGSYVQAQKAAFRSMSGDAQAEYIDAGEVMVSSMSGDGKAKNCKAETIAISSMSGDSIVECIDSRNMKVSTSSGEVKVEECQTQNSILSSISGDIDVPSLAAERLSASATSGDISLRGSFNEMEVSNASGDIIVVQQGDTRARINSRSGDVDFHLKNENGGFIANLKTHGDIDFNYNGLKMSDAASGEHRYGAERSLLDFSLISGDIRIAH